MTEATAVRAPSPIDDDPTDLDLDYLQTQVRVIHALVTCYGPPPRANVIAAGQIALDIERKDSNTRQADRVIYGRDTRSLLTVMYLLGAFIGQPEAERARLYDQHDTGWINDEAVEWAAKGVGEMLHELVNAEAAS